MGRPPAGPGVPHGRRRCHDGAPADPPVSRTPPGLGGEDAATLAFTRARTRALPGGSRGGPSGPARCSKHRRCDSECVSDAGQRAKCLIQTQQVRSFRLLIKPQHVGATARPCAGARRGAGHGLPRWQHRAGSPEGGRCRKRGAAAQRDDREALGRSRGGYGTRACVIADGKGRAIALRLAPGHAHELSYAIPLLAQLPGVPRWVGRPRLLQSSLLRPPPEHRCAPCGPDQA